MAVDRPQQVLGAGRVDVDFAGVRATDILRRCGRDDVDDFVTVDVADVARDPAELIVHRFTAPLAQHRDRLDERMREIVRRWQQPGEARVGEK
jgi:hypothetical protein